MTVKERLALQAVHPLSDAEIDAAEGRPPSPAQVAAAGAYAARVRRAPAVTGSGGYNIEPATAKKGPIVRPPHIMSLAEAGFLEPSSVVVPRVAVCTTAGEKVGKTHWAMTAPGPIAVISTDTGTREIVERFIRETGKKIVFCQLTAAAALLDAKRGDAGAGEWSRAKDAIYSVVGDCGIRTLVIDTATEVWELCRLSAFGKLAQVKPQHYAIPNGEFRNLLKYCYEDRPDLNAVWIHKHKKEYKGSIKDDTSNWTGKYERSGMADVPFLVDVVVEQFKRVERDDENLSHLYFGMRVMDSRLKPEYVVGCEFETEAGGGPGAPDQCSFTTLAMSVWPDTTPEYWR
jgi:hypothetical protein